MDSTENLAQREKDIREATAEYPGLEIGEAYQRWAKAHNKQIHTLSTADQIIRKTLITRFTQKPCPRPGCKGTIFLESICSSCIDARKGYNSKWTCDTCDYLERSTKDFSEWFEPSAKL
jgi:hypothetical protein